MVIHPCGENVLVRREICGGPILLVKPAVSPIAEVVSSYSFDAGTRVILRSGAIRLKVGDGELVSESDVLAIVL